MELNIKPPATAAECAQQEASLTLDHLTAADAMEIGQSILALAVELIPGRPLALQLETDDHPLFVYFMDGTGLSNVEWIIRKKNVTHKFGRSSYGVKLEFLER